MTATQLRYQNHTLPNYDRIGIQRRLNQTISLEESFWLRVDQSAGPDACWLWTGLRDTRGYGVFYFRGSQTKAHRKSFELATGYIDPNLFVLHACDNPPCVNPKHLSQGTIQDNVRQMYERGRAATGDRNGARLHPERVARGERHGFNVRPESRLRGEQKPTHKLTEQDVRDIRARYIRGKVGTPRLGKEFGVHPGTIDAIIKGKVWTHVK